MSVRLHWHAINTTAFTSPLFELRRSDGCWAPCQQERDDWSKNALIVAYILGNDDVFEVVTKFVRSQSARSAAVKA